DSVFAPGTVLDIDSVNDTRNLFGDKEDMLGTILMHSGAYNKLRKAGMAKNDTLFEAGRLKIVTGVDFGNVNVIVTDCATLAYDDDGADMYRILALTAGGAKVSQVKETINSDVD